MKKVLLSIVSTIFLGGFAVAQKQAPHPATNVLLVHGTFADSSSWKKVIPLLKAKGLHVVTDPSASWTETLAKSLSELYIPNRIIAVTLACRLGGEWRLDRNRLTNEVNSCSTTSS